MKEICLLLFCLNTIYSYGQTHVLRDSLLCRTIERHIMAPDCIDCDYTGISLVLVYIKRDSVRFKTIYASGNGYNLDNEIYLCRAINAKCRKYISKKDKIIIPIYFYYNNGTLQVPSAERNIAAQKRIKKLKKSIQRLEPIIITSYGYVR